MDKQTKSAFDRIFFRNGNTRKFEILRVKRSMIFQRIPQRVKYMSFAQFVDACDARHALINNAETKYKRRGSVLYRPKRYFSS